MNRERAKELVDKQDIIRAIAEGKTIQHKPCVEGATIWRDINDPTLNAPADAYRIKPEPREFWLVAAKSGRMSMTDHHPTKEAAENHMYKELELTDELWGVIKVREVCDD